MRWVLLLGVVWVLAFAHVAGSAPSSRYVLWSTRTASLPAAPARLLPADLPDDTRRGASADVLDRTTGGRLAVAALDEVVIENVDGSARAAVPVAGVYDARFSPDGSLLVLASVDCPSRDYRCENLSVVDSDGGNLHQISSHAGAARWLDDRTLAFVGDVSAAGVGTLELADPSGRVARTLGRSFSYPYPAPAPSPNGQLIVGQCRAQLVCVIGAGSVKRVVARFKGALVETPLWSPDGRRIALTLAGNGTSTTAVGTIRTASLVQVSSPAYIGTDDEVLGWSPDSRTILVQRRCAGGLLAGPTPCRDQVFSELLSTHARHRLTRDDRRWEAVRWTRTSLSYVTPPGAPAG